MFLPGDSHRQRGLAGYSPRGFRTSVLPAPVTVQRIADSSLAVAAGAARSPSASDARSAPARSLESIRQCGVALCIVLGFSILSASVGSSVVRDRVTGAKRLQLVSGLGRRTYWLTSFLCDMVGLWRCEACVRVRACACVRVRACACVCVRTHCSH